jgi:cytochrome c2
LATLAVALVCAVVLVACGTDAVGQPTVTVPDGDPVVGRTLLKTYACVTCHAIPGIRGPETYVGPPLTAWAEREYIAGNLANEPEALTDWIVNPQAIEPGTAMPTLGVSPKEARDMAAYLYTLTD